MVKLKAKKLKLVKPAETNNTKVVKKLKKKKKPAPAAVPIPDSPSDSSEPESSDNSQNSDSSESDSEQIKSLLEPYTKDQLIDLIVSAAADTPSLYTRIVESADKDTAHRKIFVHGLGWDTTKETLTSAFESYGEIEDCNVVTDRVTGKAKGFGFVLYKSRQGAVKALKEPRKMIKNRMASCQLASLGPAAAGATGQNSDTGNRKIYVSNVGPDVDADRLRAFFAKFGEIEMGPMGFDNVTGKSRGFALFLFKKSEGARKALEEPSKLFEGHQLHCQKAAEGKNNKTTSFSTTSAMVPSMGTAASLPAMAAMQNLGLFGQGLNLNPMYGGFFGNPSAGILAAGQMNPLLAAAAGQGVIGSGQAGGVGSLGVGFGGYGGAQAQGLSSLGGNQSLLGNYGTTTGSMLQGSGLQHAYPSSQLGQSSTTTRPQGSGGSFGGYSR